MKKSVLISLFCFLLLRLAGQENMITVFFTGTRDSVLVNDKKFGTGDNITLEIALENPLVVKTDAAAGTMFTLTLKFRGETLISANQEQYRNSGYQMKYKVSDIAGTYNLVLEQNGKIARITLRNKPSQAGNTTGTGGGGDKPAEIKPVVTSGDNLPGIAYYDALILANPAGLTKAELLNYFRYYFNKPRYSAINVIAMIRDSARNRYLYNSLDTAAIFKILTRPDESDKGSQSLSSAISSLSLSSIGGLDVTTIADGFAKFIVKRAKTELNIAFFDRFRELISRPEYEDLRTLFPQTYRALTAMGEEIYSYDSYIQSLRECFEKDLASLLTTMPAVLQNHPEFFRMQPELGAILESAFYIGQGLQEKQNPGDIIANYPDTVWKNCDPNYMASFRTLKMISGSVRSENPDEDGYWIPAGQLKVLATDRQVMMIYTGLLIEISRNMEIIFRVKGKEVALADLINSSYSAVGNDLPRYERFVATFAGKSADIASKIKGLKKTGSDSLLLENYYHFFTSVVDLLKYSSKVEDLPHFPKLGLKEKTDRYMDAAQTTADIVIDVNRRNYSSAVVNLYHLYSMIFTKDHLEQPLADLQAEQEQKQGQYAPGVKKLEDMKMQLADTKNPSEKEQLRQDISALQDTLQPWFDLCNEYMRLDNMTAVLNAVYKYGSFMAAVVAAQTSDEVSDAIEAAALPAGSSRIKKETKFNVCLNAYLGLYAGYEQIRGFDTSGFRLNTFGVTAPVGVALSRGHSVFFIPTGNAGWSTSAFISFIDIGAVASFRIKDDSTSQIPTIHLQDIVSPGVFLSIGFPKFPVSVNFGVQMGPNLRTVTATGNNYSNSIYLRYSASLVVDIPIFNFYSKSRD